MDDIGPVCAACGGYEADPTRRSWTAKERGYVCLDCRPGVLERGLAAIAFTRIDSKQRR